MKKPNGTPNKNIDVRKAIDEYVATNRWISAVGIQGHINSQGSRWVTQEFIQNILEELASKGRIRRVSGMNIYEKCSENRR